MKLYDILEDEAEKLKEELHKIDRREKEIWEELNHIWETQYQISRAESPRDIIIKEAKSIKLRKEQ